MSDSTSVDYNKALVNSFYTSGTDSGGQEYGQIFHPEFTVTAPGYLPWGGTSNLLEYLNKILPQVTQVLDFSRCRVVSLIGENDSVVIVVDIGLVTAYKSVVISEHWEIKEGKALSLWVAYFEPEVLIELISSIGLK